MTATTEQKHRDGVQQRADALAADLQEHERFCRSAKFNALSGVERSMFSAQLDAMRTLLFAYRYRLTHWERTSC